MPLHDHFHEPLASRRHWTSFHAAWATYISEDFNSRLPAGYFAEALAHFAIEIDVPTWQESADVSSGTAALEQWSPGPPLMTLPFSITTDMVEVLLYRNEGGPVLAGAVELISPSNKDRPESRDAFVSKCAAYLHQGVGLIVVDIVTERRANLHAELLTRVSPQPVRAEDQLYAAAYRPTGKNRETTLAVWYERLALGSPLPTLPLWLRGGICLPLDLETTYQTTVVKQRVLTNGA